jgi:hypothetical protein
MAFLLCPPSPTPMGGRTRRHLCLDIHPQEHHHQTQDSPIFRLRKLRHGQDVAPYYVRQGSHRNIQRQGLHP